MVDSLHESANSPDILNSPKRLAGDLRALSLVYNKPERKSNVLRTALKTLLANVQTAIYQMNEKFQGKYSYLKLILINSF